MGQAPAQLTEDQLAELQRWAERLVAKGAEGELGILARAIASLREEAERARAGRPVADGAELASLRSRAESVVDNRAPEQVRAAARAVLMLCDDIAAQRRHAREVHEARRRRALILVAGGAACVGLVAALAFRGGSGGLDPAGPASATVGANGLATLAFSVEGDEGDLASTTVGARRPARDGTRDRA